MTRRDADDLAQRMNGNVAQGPRWSALYDDTLKQWCVEGPSIKGGRYRLDDNGNIWYP